MGMTKSLLKGASYMAAPKTTFALNNPRKAAFAKATKWATKRMMPHRKQPSMGMMAMKGLGAAAVAIPIGMWLGRRMMGSSEA